jgi:hypothetical protein
MFTILNFIGGKIQKLLLFESTCIIHKNQPMKSILLSAIFILTALFHVKAQNQAFIKERIKFKDTIVTDKYEVDNSTGFSFSKLKVDIADYRINNTEEVDKLEQQTVTRVDLVYTDFPEGEDHAELNRKRMLELYIHLPDAMNSPVIEWNLVKQTGPKTAGALRSYFHGFVVYYRPRPSLKDEIGLIQTKVNLGIMEDSSVYKVLERQRNWKNALVICDVTGSMAPYTLQILVWLKANAKLNTFDQVVFFNDNEEQSHNQEKFFDSSGIWDIESKNGEKVVEKAVFAMGNGDHYENNLEAVCYAIKKYPQNKKNIVMIADNWENPCDMSLLPFLKKAGAVIHVVICGATNRLNTNYLDIAFATGGTVHTMEQDLTMTSAMGDGRIVKVGDLRFKMVGGKFIQL